MKYAFKYFREATLGRFYMYCPDIPGIHVELVKFNPLEAFQLAFDALNLYIPVAILNKEKINFPKFKDDNCFFIDVTGNNKIKILNQR